MIEFEVYVWVHQGSDPWWTQTYTSNSWLYITLASPGHLAKWVMCLTADPGVTSSIPALSHTFTEFDHETISTAVLLPIMLIEEVLIRPKEKYALLPVTCPKMLGLVGRQTFFFIKTFLHGKSIKILKNSLK